MTEPDARGWIEERWPGRTPLLERFAHMVREENTRQNLIAASTVDAIWTRHLLDSAQLAALAPPSDGPWVDVGTGGGFPGLICALLRPEPVWLVEPRRRRAEFLQWAANMLGLGDRVHVHACRVERVSGNAGVISARAVAGIGALLTMCRHLLVPRTTLLLPRGRIDEDEVAAARTAWNMLFHVEPSITSADSDIAILTAVASR